LSDGGVLGSAGGHLENVLSARLGMCDEKLARIPVSEAPKEVRELEKLGMRFERE